MNFTFLDIYKIRPSNIGWLLLVPGGEDISAKHVKFPLIREREDFNSRGVDLVVGDVDQPGAEETSPANCQHHTDGVRGQVMLNAVDIRNLDSYSFSDIQFSMNGQAEKIMMIFFILPSL